jgi:threonine aldolase
MGNQLALRCLGRPGTSVVVGVRQHVVIYENGAAGTNSGIQFHLVDDTDGTIDPTAVSWAIEAAEHHYPPVSAVCIENTHMPAGGVPWPPGAIAAIAACGVPVHLDGARLFNAEVATGEPAASIAEPATTVMCCLSKGLASPVGSLLAGPVDLIDAARQERKRLGGAMRQAGVVAAAGLVSLNEMVDRMSDDHTRARTLAAAVAERWPALALDPTTVLTNVVVFAHDDPPALIAHLAAHGIRAGTIAPRVMRLMTHLDIDDGGVDRAIKALRDAP